MVSSQNKFSAFSNKVLTAPALWHSRTRKIRCDGAKPICLHCSRRSTTNPDDSTLCTYDSAPKRRGPDKNPGSRQRISAHESTHGGKVRRRRRRDTGPTDKLIPMAAQGPSDPAMSPGDGMEPLPRVPHAEGHAVGVPYGLEPLAQVPSAGPSISREVRIAEVYRAAPQQPVAAPVDKLPSISTAHDVSLRDITHPPHGLHRAATMSEPQYGHSQVRLCDFWNIIPSRQMLTMDSTSICLIGPCSDIANTALRA